MTQRTNAPILKTQPTTTTTMIIADKTNKTKFEGNFETINVGIDEKNIAHFFRMIANLYQDPITAVLREIGANCLDAAKEAKTESLGWELHLPSKLDANVRFIDNGVGISHEQMIRIYSIIGASTKRDSNNLIGGFGVGKWSLCSLVNNFQAISTFNGTRTQYFISLQSSGLPDIKVIKSEQTTDRNGFEIKFLCPNRYIDEMVQKSRRVYTFFDIQPKFFLDGKQLSGHATDMPKPLFAPKVKDRFEIFGRDAYQVETCVVMGGVAYALPMNRMMENAKFKKFDQLLNSKLIIHAPIGEYSITPSREAIQMDDLTTDRLVARLTSIIDTFIPEMQNQMDAFDGNLLDAKKFIISMKKNFSFLPKGIKLNWKGIEVDDEKTYILKNKVKIRSYVSSPYYKKIDLRHTDNIFLEENAYIFFDDATKGGIGRVRHFLSDHKSSVAYLVDESNVDAVKAELNWVGEMQKTSSLTPPPKQVKVTKSGVSASTLRMRSDGSWRLRDEVAPFDANDKKISSAEFLILFPYSNLKLEGNGVMTLCPRDTDPFMLIVIEKIGISHALFLPVKDFNSFDDEDVAGIPVYKIADFLKRDDVKEKIADNFFKVTKDEVMESVRTLLGWDSRNLPACFVNKPFVSILKKELPSKHFAVQIADKLKNIYADESEGVCRKSKALFSMFTENMDAFKQVKVNADNAIKEVMEGINLLQKKYAVEMEYINSHANYLSNGETWMKEVVRRIAAFDFYLENKNK